MSEDEPTPQKPPEDKPDHPHGTPPGQDPDFVPPGHGGTPPGQEDKPDKPDKPEEPDDIDDPHPAHPIVDPDHPEHPIAEPEAAARGASVESLVGLRDFLAVAPRRRSVASTQAASAALQRWMRLHGHDTNGFYTMNEWQTFYTDMLADTGSPRVPVSA